jgi:hypothetical protein
VTVSKVNLEGWGIIRKNIIWRDTAIMECFEGYGG